MESNFEFIPIPDWFAEKLSIPLLISGPCSAESELQVMQTAEKLAENSSVQVFRAGLWKPRTRPDSFEGVGRKGLKWLRKVKSEFGFRVTVEVASRKHLNDCIDNDIDIVWLGARTTSNPFSVQEIADALEGKDVPVLIKNPINPDIELWCGAIERLANAGIKKIAAVHRGFYPFEKTNFRNIPKWEIPIELKTCFKELPILCDPSHIAGDTKYIEEIAQKALDINMDGLMIESHINPKNALSDAGQQLDPDALFNLIGNLSYRCSELENIEFRDLLDQYRDRIDSIDSQIIELLGQRMKIVEEIGKYKSDHNVIILDIKRWEEIINSRTELGKKLNLPDDFIKKLLQLIHKTSIHKQTEVMNKFKKN